MYVSMHGYPELKIKITYITKKHQDQIKSSRVSSIVASEFYITYHVITKLKKYKPNLYIAQAVAHSVIFLP